MTAMQSPAGGSGAATLVIQTRLRPESAKAFAAWQAETSRLLASFPGFVDCTVMPPAPPAQLDWIILQRFIDVPAAVGWLQSSERQQRLPELAAMVSGPDDVHIVSDDGGGRLPSPVSAVMSITLKPGQEAAHRAWERRITAVQSRAPGFQGHRSEPPIPGVQDHWLSIVRFDTEENLNAWLASPERQKLVAEASEFTARFHARIARTGFDQWFPVSRDGAPPIAVWSAPLALTRALRNLIINAATHGGGAFITVVPQGDTALIRIEDEGPGIPEQIMPRVFEPFFRVDPGRRKSVPGAGLGLAIAKEIVERHGGQLSLHNRLPRGLRQEVVFSAVSAQSTVHERRLRERPPLYRSATKPANISA